MPQLHTAVPEPWWGKPLNNVGSWPRPFHSHVVMSVCCERCSKSQCSQTTTGPFVHVCAQAGVLAHRAGLLERAPARICREAVARVATSIALRVPAKSRPEDLLSAAEKPEPQSRPMSSFTISTSTPRRAAAAYWGCRQRAAPLGRSPPRCRHYPRTGPQCQRPPAATPAQHCIPRVFAGPAVPPRRACHRGSWNPGCVITT